MDEVKVPGKVLILVRGVSGSGKSTFAKSMSNAISTSIGTFCSREIAADDFCYNEDGEYCFDPSKMKENHLKCQEQVKEWMIDGYSFIFVHNTFTAKWEMEPYFKLAEGTDYQVTTIVMENRHGSKDLHDVPEEALLAQKNRFEIEL